MTTYAITLRGQRASVSSVLMLVGDRTEAEEIATGLRDRGQDVAVVPVRATQKPPVTPR